MDIEFRNGLLFTSLEITFQGMTKMIDNIVIDTGAAETLISPDIVEEIGIVAALTDRISSFYGVGGSLHNFFSKEVDRICLGSIDIINAKLDFSVIDPAGDINGLLGLDLLMEMGAVIDLKKLTMIVNY
ncbi:MAG TPA: aspartyl protease [Clostridiales bacterium]|nr:aspartyl protease [Clostridiales bacterium]